MKKIYFSILIIITIFLININVFAETYQCDYGGTDVDGTTKIKVAIDINTEESGDSYAYKDIYVHFGSSDNPLRLLFYGSDYNILVGGATITDYYNDTNIGSAVDYYKTNDACPPYLFLIYDYMGGDEGIHYMGVLSDSTYETNTTGYSASSASYKLSCTNTTKEEKETGKSETGETVESEKECAFDFKIKKAETFEYKVNYIITSTSATSDNATLLPEADFYGTSCLAKAYMCEYWDGSSEHLYLAKDQATMLKDENLFNALSYAGLSEIYGDCSDDDKTDGTCLELLIDYGVYCSEVKEGEATVVAGNSGCTVFTDYAQKINSNENASTNYLKLKKYCSSVIKYQDYDSDVDSCINKCLNMSNYITNSSIIDDSTLKCYLSDDARSFLKNIVKWVKLILPVLLIILSIFDFLRAIANENEGMKRAKKHLINRLIALAILYTLPSFIQFFLERFGFVYKECEIFMIKLLK